MRLLQKNSDWQVATGDWSGKPLNQSLIANRCRNWNNVSRELTELSEQVGEQSQLERFDQFATH
jgi:hypothetical protein